MVASVPHGGATSVWRDFVVTGNPASGAHKPIKAEIRDLIAALEYCATVEVEALKVAAGMTMPSKPLQIRSRVIGDGDSTKMQEFIGLMGNNLVLPFNNNFPSECSRQAKGNMPWCQAFLGPIFDVQQRFDGGEYDSGKLTSGHVIAFAAQPALTCLKRAVGALPFHQPAAIELSVGINDLAIPTTVAGVQAAAATVTAALSAYAALCRRYGIYLIIRFLPPRSIKGRSYPITPIVDPGWSKTDPVDIERRAQRLTINTAIVNLAAASGGAVIAHDTDALWRDPVTDEWLPDMTEDGVHQSQYAAYLAGKDLAQKLITEGLFGDTIAWPWIKDQLTNNLATNPNLTGTGGTIGAGAAGTGISGTIASSLQLARADSGTGITCVASKGTDGLAADGVTTLNTQILTFTGGGAAAVENFWLTVPGDGIRPIIRPNLADGTEVQLQYLVTWTGAGSGMLRGISPRLSALNWLDPAQPLVLTEVYAAEGMQTKAPQLYKLPAGGPGQDIWLTTPPVMLTSATRALTERFMLALNAVGFGGQTLTVTIKRRMIRVVRSPVTSSNR